MPRMNFSIAFFLSDLLLIVVCNALIEVLVDIYICEMIIRQDIMVVQSHLGLEFELFTKHP